jgi:hypothetical protein
MSAAAAAAAAGKTVRTCCGAACMIVMQYIMYTAYDSSTALSYLIALNHLLLFQNKSDGGFTLRHSALS